MNSFGQDFYIKIPINGASTTSTITITPKYSTRELQYRTTESSPSSKQPIVVIENKNLQETKTSNVQLTPPVVDLALRKFITGVTDNQGNSKEIDNLSGRTPTVDASSLQPTGTTNTTAEYKHRKDPVKVETGDIVKYTLRIYNEGNAKGLATEITDQLPTGLKYKGIEVSTYEANYTESTNKLVLTRKNKNEPLDEFTAGETTPDYEDIKITCEVTAEENSSQVLTNIAWISKEYNATTNEEFTETNKDRDSAPVTIPTYSNDWKGTVDTDKEQNEQKYYKGQQDDDDFEKLVLKPVVSNKIDLALRKYISKVENSDGQARSGSSRTLTVDETPLQNGATTATYTLSKNPIQAEKNDFIYYNLRIFNEGPIEGRATEITDQLPTGIELVTSGTITSTNGNTYSIAYNNTTNVVTLTNSGTTNLPAYTEGSLQDNGNGHETITLKCKVTEDVDAQNPKKLTNVAWISHQTDENDRDSSPATHPDVNKDNMSEYATNQEDDDDYEKIILQPIPPEPKEFDLALRKFVSAVDGRAINTPRDPKITDTEKSKLPTKTATFDNGTTAEKTHSKEAIEINTGNIVTFTIRVYNEGQVDGAAKQITDYIPSGLEFVEGTENNSNWNYDQTTRKATTKNSIELTAFNQQTGEIDYEDIEIDCRVIATRTEGNNQIKNIAEITQIENAENLPDRDSTNPLTDNQKSNYNPETAPRGKGYEDDDDYENLRLPDLTFDLALRKYIVEVDGQPQARTPNVNTASLANRTSPLDSGNTATKPHSKDALKVAKGSKIKYRITVYNEGDVNGTATKITDYLPEGLKLVENSDINRNYGWAPESTDPTGRTVSTAYLATKNINAFDGTTISDESVEIECEVVGSDLVSRHLKNVTEITEERNDAGITSDRDSNPNNLQQRGDNYNASTSTQGKGYEDDDDYEDLLLIRFDLALRKFITGVNKEQITNRQPTVDTSKMGTIGADGKEITTFTYNQTKEPVRVEQNNIITYTIRAYNEGSVDAYAELIKDDIPEGLEFLPEDAINIKYGWKLLDQSGNPTTDVKKAKFVTTDYRSKAKSTTENLIKAFNKETMETPDFRDVEIAFKVTQPAESDRIVINKAQITRHSDGDGNTNIKDIDSTPDVWIEGEDDQDTEKIYVKYFDLALRKWTTHAIVIEDGVQKEMETGHTADDNPESVVKIEINKKRLEDTVVKFRYSIKVINEGEIAGSATEITDYIPKGLKFNQADNPKWIEAEGKVTTDQLKDTILQPGETATVDLLLTWENSESNMGIMTNVAEISGDYNESGTPDIDSIPDNRKEGEDDIDEAPIAITVVAGSAPTYIAIASGITLIIGGGIFFIKKYVI